MAIKPPCKGCEERQIGCHSTCERYKAFRADLDEQNAKRAEIKSANDATARSVDRLIGRYHWNHRRR